MGREETFEETVEEIVEESVDEDAKEHPTKAVSVDGLTERFGETNHLYPDRDDLSQAELEWEHRKRELVEQEIVKRIESEEEGQFTRDIRKILSEAESNGANVQAETEALTTYLIENTDTFHDRFRKESVKHRLEAGRSQSEFFKEEALSEEPEISEKSIADTADKAVIAVGVITLFVPLLGIAFAGTGITITGMSLLAFTGKITGALTILLTVLGAVSQIIDRE